MLSASRRAVPSTSLESRADEHREHLEHPALGLGEELGAPLDRAPQRALPLRAVAPPALQHVEPFVEPRPQLVGREQRDARGGELDRERQPVEPAAGGDDVGRVLVGELEVGPQRDRALDEQLDRLRCERVFQRDCAVAGGERERRHREQPLAAHAQRRTAGHERADTRAMLEQLGQAGRGVGHLFEVVEQEQQLPLAQAALEHLEWRVVAGTGDRHGADDGGVGAVRFALGAQVDEEHAVLEAVDLLRRRLQREPRFARPTRTGERHQPRVLRVELRRAARRAAPRARGTPTSASAGCSAARRGSLAAGRCPAGPAAPAGRGARGRRDPSGGACRGRAGARRRGATL